MGIAERIDATIDAVLKQAGAEIVSEIKDSLDTPYPGASTVGENPHKRSGDLQNGIASEVLDSGEGPALVVSSAAPYSRRLEEGMGRPILLPALEKWTSEIAQRLSSAFRT